MTSTAFDLLPLVPAALFLAATSLLSCVDALPYHKDNLPSSWRPTVRWSNCSANDPTGIQCGFITVPLDHEHRAHGTVELGMVRLSTTQSPRLGTLYYNPGGPGGAASDYILEATLEGSQNFGSSVLQDYAIVGLDPRGVGMSQPVKCDPHIYNERISSFPTTAIDFQNLFFHNKLLGKSCAELTGPLINYLDTVSVARDLELVRQAINHREKLNFFGRSYGSQIGQTYAELFPGNINRMAMDGIVDHTQSETVTLNEEATTYELTMNQFFAWCNITTGCALHGQDAAAVFDSVIRSAEENALPAPSCLLTGACRSDVTGEEIRSNVQGLLLFQNANTEFTGWDTLSRAIAHAAEGNATLLSSPLATSETSPAFPGLAIGCQDWLHESTSLADLTYKINMASATAPRMRGSSQSFYYQTNCVGWPAPTRNPQRRLRHSVLRAPPMLLVNALYDPSTSIVWATEIQRQLGDSVLLTRNGSGHTSYQLRGEAAAAIDTFLVEGILPHPATVVAS